MRDWGKHTDEHTTSRRYRKKCQECENEHARSGISKRKGDFSGSRRRSRISPRQSSSRKIFVRRTSVPCQGDRREAIFSDDEDRRGQSQGPDVNIEYRRIL